MKEILQDMSYDELQSLVLSLGEKKFRAAQLSAGLTQGKKISEISTLPGALKEKLLERFEDAPVQIRERFTSADGTEKFLFSLSDGNLIEGVAMRYKYGVTQCVSTQVGCRMGCSFCASTLGGLVRNLTAGEILSQILTVNALLLAENAKKEGGMPALNKVYDAFFCFCAARYAAQRACCCTGMPFRDAGRNFFGFGRFFGNGVSFFLICTFIHLTYARMCDIITGNLRESDALS